MLGRLFRPRNNSDKHFGALPRSLSRGKRKRRNERRSKRRKKDRERAGEGEREGYQRWKDRLILCAPWHKAPAYRGKFIQMGASKFVRYFEKHAEGSFSPFSFPGVFSNRKNAEKREARPLHDCVKNASVISGASTISRFAKPPLISPSRLSTR